MDKEEPKIIEVERGRFQIPICCREGWKDCVHCTPKPKKEKRQIAL